MTTPNNPLPAPSPHDLRNLRTLARERWLAGRKAESQYVSHLRSVADQIGKLVRGMAPDGVLTSELAEKLKAALRAYSKTLQPWAESVASRMIADVSRRDAAAWERHGKAIGRALRKEINGAPTGVAARQALAEQVKLITSLPIDAAERVHKLTLEGITKGTRASEIASEILKSGEVSKSRAMVIARTEVARTATALTRARAEFIGSAGYIWRTTRDRAVRPSHRAMEGKVVNWNDPPTLDGMSGHAGEFPNCRCFPEVVIPDKFSK